MYEKRGVLLVKVKYSICFMCVSLSTCLEDATRTDLLIQSKRGVSVSYLTHSHANFSTIYRNKSDANSITSFIQDIDINLF